MDAEHCGLQQGLGDTSKPKGERRTFGGNQVAFDPVGPHPRPIQVLDVFHSA